MNGPQRGKKFDDVLRRDRLPVAVLQDVDLQTGDLSCLAILFFLSRHAVGRALVLRHGAIDVESCEEDDRGK